MITRLALLIGAGLMGAPLADTPRVEPRDSNASSNPYTLLSGESGVAGRQTGEQLQAEESVGCPYSLAPVEIDGGGTLAVYPPPVDPPEGNENIYSLMGSMTWIGSDEQSTGGDYTLDTGFWDTAGGPRSCIPLTPFDDCNWNGIHDECDIALRFSLDEDDNCVPDECDDCLCPGCPSIEMKNACRIDCYAFGDREHCGSGCGQSNDCNANGIPDECDPDCDADGFPDDCEPDCDCDCDGIPELDPKPEVRIYVKTDAPLEPPPNGDPWDSAFPDLEAALEEAKIEVNNGNMVEIWVAAGTYVPTESTSTTCLVSLDPRCAHFELISCTALYGGFAGDEETLDQRDPAGNVTILSGDLDNDDVAVPCTQDSPACDSYGGMCVDGFCIVKQNNDDNSYNVVDATQTPEVDSSAVLDGFTITGGNANHDSLILRQRGGGLVLTTSSPTISNCVFQGNYAMLEGGGVAQIGSGTTSFSNCDFHGNAARHGAGLFSQKAKMRLVDCLFEGNKAVETGGGARLGLGGAPMHTSLLVNCVFRGNHAGASGGGLSNDPSLTELINCVFVNNTAGDSGGGMYSEDSVLSLHSCTIAGNHAANSGGQPLVAGGVSNVDSALSITNTILWGNTADNITNLGEQQISGGAVGISYGLIEGLSELPAFNLPFSGNFAADPMFADLDAGDAHLASGSPAIDQGRYLSLPLDPFAARVGVPEPLTFDADNLPRVAGAELDVGAYEFLCNRRMTLADHTVFAGCMAGPDAGIAYPDCLCSDLDGDEDVDLRDHAEFQVMFVGQDEATP